MGLSIVGYDRALELLAADAGTRYAVRRNDDTFTIVSIEGVPSAAINGVTFDALWLAGRIVRAPEYDTDAGVVYVHRDFDPAERHARQMVEAAAGRTTVDGTAPDHDETAGIAFDTAHTPINLAATLAADAAFAAIADDAILYIDRPDVQIAMAQVSRSARFERDAIDALAIAMYRLMDRVPDGETMPPALAKAYQRLNAAAEALFDARATLLAAVRIPDAETTVPFVMPTEIGR